MIHYHLQRFTEAQDNDYETALAEIKNGQKRSHWMWYIFPQIAGLGTTATSKFYAIKDIGEATAYLMDEQLSLRLVTICKALIKLKTRDALAVFGAPDHLKLRSSMTLFDAVPATFPVFGQVLEKFFNGERDLRTLDLLQASRS
ncbi:uncharacterized protein (DUF1810 family) [Mucilaginibacter yixingensis]|uniref:Uncharacterized protein (DUF1810 family) n=1 Tax=Mucilaginibacter yixingensis TaxID=1295612 RepID=A0A2T5JE89_9SPHI|nr:DUF1810 domain-containing protein [Mucilaginibacter yixingensis]PTR00088.1 uncharacterized protein (DUF1810 family) [Mucilaginibacter yixingensis]